MRFLEFIRVVMKEKMHCHKFPLFVIKMRNSSKSRCNTPNSIKILLLTVSLNLVRSKFRSNLNFALAVFFVALVFGAVTIDPSFSAEQSDMKLCETKLDIDFEQTSVLFSMKFA